MLRCSYWDMRKTIVGAIMMVNFMVVVIVVMIQLLVFELLQLSRSISNTLFNHTNLVPHQGETFLHLLLHH